MGGLTGAVPVHPSQFSPEVLVTISELLRPDEHVHDPFAGMGRRLGAVCDGNGCTFTGTDIEAWPGHDPRVAVGDARDARTYPPRPFTIVTSPVYLNRMSTDYVNGPTPDTKAAGRHAYGISLGRALDADNLARVCRSTERYYAAHEAAVMHWARRVIVNVDGPMAYRWMVLLQRHGYTVGVISVRTRRLGGVANHLKRAPHEVILLGIQPANTDGPPT